MTMVGWWCIQFFNGIDKNATRENLLL